jgi:predicted membrane metal-binding protein
MVTRDTHESFDRDEVRASSDRAFGFVFAAVFAIVGLWPSAFGEAPRFWALALALAFLAVAVIWPRLLHPLNRAWFKFGLLLHHVVTPVVMGLIFIVGVLPTALIMRLRRKDPLRLGRRGESNWVVRTPPGPAPESMKNLF